jgi:Tannase and feruloyl esterase
MGGMAIRACRAQIVPYRPGPSYRPGFARGRANQVYFEVWLPLPSVGTGNSRVSEMVFSPARSPIIRWPRGSKWALRLPADTGHNSTEPQLWLENQDLVIDYSYRGLHLTTVNAKAIIAAFYSRALRFSYYSRCSTGGKQAHSMRSDIPMTMTASSASGDQG